MPKKRIQCKEKSKRASEESEEFALRENPNENAEEEYTNVVEFENNLKYNKRLIQNNWSKYEANLSDFDTEDEKNTSPKTENFTYLVETSSSDCSHFEFNSEKLWKSEYNSLPASKIFNLDLNILSKGLACVPFYKRLGLDEGELSVEDKKYFDRAAENSWKDYNAIREEIAKKEENDLKIKNLENDSKTLEKSFTVKLDLGNNNEENQKKVEDLKVEDMIKTDKIVKKNELFLNSQSGGNNLEESKQKLLFSDSGENLEDWLDSVLDD